MADHIYTTEIVDEVAEDTQVSDEIVRGVLDSAFGRIMSHVAGGTPVVITGFGRFERRYMKPRKLADHLTKDEENVHDIPGHFRVGFHVGATFRGLARAAA